MNVRTVTVILRLICLSLVAPSVALAQSYPGKAVHLVVGYQAGTGVDFVARVVAGKLSDALGQPFVVDNRPGAAANIAAAAVSKAAPDGYTLLVTNNSHAINPTIYSKLEFDSVKDFSPISVTGSSPMLMVAHPTLAANSVKELVDLARRKPGELNLASAGTGSPSHLAGALFTHLTGIKVVHVAYKGAPAALADLLAGRVSLYVSGLPPVIPLVKAGKVRPIAVTTAQRSTALPDVPSFADAGISGYDVLLWYGFLAPAKTPRDVVAKLNQEIVRAVNAPDVKAQFDKQGIDPTTSTPEQFAERIRSEMRRWTEVVKAANIRVD